MTPIRLGPNQPARFFRGGAAIARFRGVPQAEDHLPEDWIGSTTALFGAAPLGLTSLPDGRALRDAVASEPERFLGAEHVTAFGADTAILVKLLDAGERLPVHLDSDRQFARENLASRYGKWLRPDPAVECDPGCSVLVVVEGAGRLVTAGGALDVTRGDTILVPRAAGPGELTGAVEAIRCRPPHPGGSV